MMKIEFEENDRKELVFLISEYRNVSNELESARKTADEIKKKIDGLVETLECSKEREKALMESLHRKYGEFSLNDVYDQISDRL